MHISEHYGDVDYYETTAGVHAVPDGTVTIRDGYGSEIRMTGGNNEISCPGDVIFRPGRSLIGPAGDDAVTRDRSWTPGSVVRPYAGVVERRRRRMPDATLGAL